MKLDIKRLGVNGEGIGFYYKKPVFVDRTIPEETVTVKPILETNTYILKLNFLPLKDIQKIVWCLFVSILRCVVVVIPNT